MNKYFFTITLILSIGALSFAQNPNRSGKDYAYFFYIDDYQNRAWSDLPETKTESEKIAAELSSTYGFYTELIRNPSKTDIENKFLKIRQKSFGKKDQVLFFFSGHGYFDNRTERGFFIPADGKSLRNDPLSKTWLSYDDLGSYLALNNCKHTLVALDACYSGAFGDRWKGGDDIKLPWEQEDDCAVKEQKGLGFPGAFYFSSGNKKQKTPAKSKFASKFLEFLRDRQNEVLYVKNLRYYLSFIEFPEPEGGTFSAKHEEGGNFIFMKKNACGSSKTVTDQSHWANLQENVTRGGLIEHLSKYPQCSHEKEVIFLLGGGESEKTPDTSIEPTPNLNRRLSEPEMIYVEGGTFKMGCTSEQSDCDDDEKPVHSVTVSSFYIGKYEITVQEYLKFCDETGSNYPEWLEKESSYHIDTGTNDYYKKKGYNRSANNLPVVGVSWNDANAYCKWLSKKSGKSYRLPTEAEWEFAARGGKKSKDYQYSGSNTVGDVAWYNGNSDSKTHFVGTKKANELGIFDMSGNVWEWCLDDRRDYTTGSQTNPKGSTTSSSRALRGGSWYYISGYTRVANRLWNVTDIRSLSNGFRVVRDR